MRDRSDGKQGSEFWFTLPITSEKIRLLKDFCNIYIIETKDFLVIIPLNNILQEGFYFMKRKYVLLIGGSIIVGGILWSLFRPEKLFIDKQVNEALPQTEIQSNKTKQQEERVISTGQFQNGVHETTGTATIHQLGRENVFYDFQIFQLLMGQMFELY